MCTIDNGFCTIGFLRSELKSKKQGQQGPVHCVGRSGPRPWV